EFSGAAFKPTTGTLYEGGVKYQPPGYNGFFQISVFDITEQNVLTADPAHPGFSTQVGEIESRGVEFEGKLSLTDQFSMVGAAAYADPKVTASPNNDLGKIPVNVPRVTASAWADYTLREGQFNGLGFGGGVRYTGKTYADPANHIPVPDYIVVDAALHYD